jgi:hypothetical protein
VKANEVTVEIVILAMIAAFLGCGSMPFWGAAPNMARNRCKAVWTPGCGCTCRSSA